jgi:hypothetical protein
MHEGVAYIPDTNEVDININGESSLESGALSPTYLVVARVHFVCERDLLVIALWQQPNLR